MKQFFTTTCFVLSAIVAAGSAHANALNYSEYEQLFGEPVTTGATGTPQRASDVPLDMTIITQDDIKRSAARDIPDILRQVPGVNVRRNGNGWADVSIRGYNQPMSSRVLVLLDGRQAYQEDYGYTNWSLIPVQLSEIQQIEVIRGPNTALYGFNAVSGVINILTKNPLYTQSGSAKANYGLHNYREGSVTTQQKLSDSLGISASLGGRAVDDGITGRGGFAGTTRLSDPDNYAGRLGAYYQLDDTSQLSITASQAVSSPNTNLIEEATTPAYFSSKSLTANYNTEGAYGLVDVKLYHTNTSTKFDRLVRMYDDALTDFSVSDVFKLGASHSFRLQAGWRNYGSDIIGTSAKGDKITYNIPSASAAWTWNMSDQWSWTNAIRYDRFILNRSGPTLFGGYTADQFDRNIGDYSLNSGLVFKASDTDSLRLNLSRGVQLPNIVGLSLQTMVGPTPATGNPYLPISVTRNVELGWEHKIPEYHLTTSTSIFYQRAGGIITSPSIFTGGGEPGPFLNTEAMGGELGVDGTFAEHWRYGASYSLAEVNDRSPYANYTRTYSKSSPNHQWKGNLGWADGDWTADTFLSYASSFNTQGPFPRQVDGVWQLDAKVNYQITPQFSTALTLIGATDDTWNESGTRSLENQRSAILSAEYRF